MDRIRIHRPSYQFQLQCTHQGISYRIVETDRSILLFLKRAAFLVTILIILVLEWGLDQISTVDAVGYGLLFITSLLTAIQFSENNIVNWYNDEELRLVLEDEIEPKKNVYFTRLTRSLPDSSTHKVENIKEKDKESVWDTDESLGFLVCIMQRDEAATIVANQDPLVLTRDELLDISAYLSKCEWYSTTDTVYSSDLGDLIPVHRATKLLSLEEKGKERLITLMMFWPFLLMYFGILWLVLDFMTELSIPYFLWLFEMTIIFGYVLLRRLFK